MNETNKFQDKDSYKIESNTEKVRFYNFILKIRNRTNIHLV